MLGVCWERAVEGVMCYLCYLLEPQELDTEMTKLLLSTTELCWPLLIPHFPNLHFTKSPASIAIKEVIPTFDRAKGGCLAATQKCLSFGT